MTEAAAEPLLGGKLAENVVHFAGFLRRAGLPVGTAQVLEAIASLQLVGLGRKTEVFAALRATFVSRREHEALFALGFETFWRDPFGSTEALSRLLPPSKMDRPGKPQVPRRLREAWRGIGPRSVPKNRPSAKPDVEIDMRNTASVHEVLKHKDFDELTAEEEAEVKRILSRFRFPWREIRTRRTRPASHGSRIDLRRTLHASRRAFGEPLRIEYRVARTRPPPLVVLCDVSGSMERYSRMVMHFFHALTNDRDRVSVFVFGTRLTPVTRALRHRDVDVAFGELASVVQDWDGGTRIGSCLETFRREWARRVLGGSATVLLVTDGLERDDPHPLAETMERLSRWCRRLVWLNPLLGNEGFEPKAKGMAAILPHVHEHRPVHDLASLEALAKALG
ncbi:MAG: VWA domain-containing protein, partial [Myxococcota bacterium]